MKKRFFVFDCINYLFLLLLAFSALYPFWYTLVLSLSSRTAVTIGVKMIPKSFSLISYRMVFNTPDILTAYYNSVVRTLLGAILTLVVCYLAAYALSKTTLPFRKTLNFIVLFTMLFNGGIIPGYLLIRSLNLLDSLWALVLPMVVSPWYIFFLRNYIRTIPSNLEESAMIDGANSLIVLWKIILPLSKPVLATIALWTAVNHWNAWFDALLYIDSPKGVVLQQILQRIVIFNNVDLIRSGVINPNLSEFTPETIRAATIIAVMLPIMIVYPFLQKYFVKGLMVGSVKG